MTKFNNNRTDLRNLFHGLQESMIKDLETIRKNINHAPTKGDGAEKIWIQFLKDYLPKRYSIDKAIIIDSEGNTSDAIDVVIYDTQYTPFVLNKNSIIYIPAESVYAVFEAKQEINKTFLKYAFDKVESVRKLNRTTAPVVERGELRPAPQLFNIIGGFLCLDNGWKTSINTHKSFNKIITETTSSNSLEIGCVLNDGAFIKEADSTNGLIKINFSKPNETLIYFFLKLVAELQKLGTVRPIDLNKYIDQLDSQ